MTVKMEQFRRPVRRVDTELRLLARREVLKQLKRPSAEATENKLGEVLREFRINAFIGPGELAARVGTTREIIIDIEAGKMRIPRDTLKRYAAALWLTNEERDTILWLGSKKRGGRKEPVTELGRTIRRLRMERGMTQKQLADKAGVDRGMVCCCEVRERIPRRAALESIADAFGLRGTAREVLTGKGVAHDEYANELGHTLRGFRLRAGLLQRDLAALVGVTRDTVCGIETGHKRHRHLTPEKLKAYAAALGLGEEDTKTLLSFGYKNVGGKKEPRTELGKMLRNLRERRNMTMAELEEKLGMRRSYVSVIELGVRRANRKHIERAIDAFELRGTELERELIRLFESQTAA